VKKFNKVLFTLIMAVTPITVAKPIECLKNAFWYVMEKTGCARRPRLTPAQQYARLTQAQRARMMRRARQQAAQFLITHPVLHQSITETMNKLEEEKENK